MFYDTNCAVFQEVSKVITVLKESGIMNKILVDKVGRGLAWQHLQIFFIVIRWLYTKFELI
jgi:DUF1009 family protein